VNLSDNVNQEFIVRTENIADAIRAAPGN